jgi:UDP-N-acetylmuramyl pentapeptide phosphotransferase/UDP-N-acetylglucosamine-1-phosphate transferase
LAVLDVPNTRSSHHGNVVRGAGIALAAGILTALLAGRSVGLATGVAVVGFTGLGAWDDIKTLSARLRLALQFALAAVVSLAVVRSSGAPLWMAAIGTFLLTATTNAVNFMDGVNGITAEHAAIWGVVYSTIILRVAGDGSVDLGAALVGAAVAFLPWNVVNARAFLGDSGSYLVGGVVGLLAMGTWLATGPIVALCPLAVYAADTGATVLRRQRAGEELTQAHHEHTYQRLLDLGWTHAKCAGSVSVATLLCSVLAVVAAFRPGTPQFVPLLGTLAICGVYLGLPHLIETRASTGRGDMQAHSS